MLLYSPVMSSDDDAADRIARAKALLRAAGTDEVRNLKQVWRPIGIIFNDAIANGDHTRKGMTIRQYMIECFGFSHTWGYALRECGRASEEEIDAAELHSQTRQDGYRQESYSGPLMGSEKLREW